MNNDEAMLVLLWRGDRRIDSHIRIMIVIAIALFGVLIFLRGAWYRPLSFGVVILILAYVMHACKITPSLESKERGKI